MNRTMAQRRAAHALARVTGILNDPTWDGEARERYAAYVERLAASILVNGLGQAAALERAGGAESREHMRLYEDLQSWLCAEGGPYRGGDLLQAIVNEDRDTYLRAQAEALAWVEWLKSFAVAYLKTSRPREGEGW